MRSDDPQPDGPTLDDPAAVSAIADTAGAPCARTRGWCNGIICRVDGTVVCANGDPL